MNKFFKAVSFSTLFFLSGCAMVQPTTARLVGHPMSWKARSAALNEVQSWTAKGSVSIQHTEKADLASLKWEQHSHNDYQFALFGPLGFGRVQIIGNPNQITLTQSGKPPISAATPELLLQNQLGWQIPVSHLYYWGRGLPAPGASAKMSFDAYNHLLKLKQEKWEIEYLEYMQVGSVDLPKKIQLTHDKLKVKLVVKSWVVGL